MISMKEFRENEYVIVVLDLQNKLEFMNYCFNRMYASEEAKVMTKK